MNNSSTFYFWTAKHRRTAEAHGHTYQTERLVLPEYAAGTVRRVYVFLRRKGLAPSAARLACLQVADSTAKHVGVELVGSYTPVINLIRPKDR